MKKTKTYCDICESEVPDYIHQSVEIAGHVDMSSGVCDHKKLELCRKCGVKFFELYWKINQGDAVSELKRYRLHGEGFTYIREDSQGGWVKFEDVQPQIEALESENKRLREALKPFADHYKKHEKIILRLNQELQIEYYSDNRKAFEAMEGSK